MDEEVKKQRRQYICHSNKFNHLLIFPGDNYIGVKMYDLLRNVYIGKL